MSRLRDWRRAGREREEPGTRGWPVESIISPRCLEA